MILAKNGQLEISDEQKKQLISECNSAHLQIEKAIAEIEERQRECREKMLSIFEDVLTDAQKEKFAKKLDINDVLNGMSMSDLEADTDASKK